MSWDIRNTAFVMMWSMVMRWRYIRIYMFAWTVLGYSRGWPVAVEALGFLVVGVMFCLLVASLVDVGLSTRAVLKARTSAVE
jgi:type III secretory pathway component EscU